MIAILKCTESCFLHVVAHLKTPLSYQDASHNSCRGLKECMNTNKTQAKHIKSSNYKKNHTPDRC